MANELADLSAAVEALKVENKKSNDLATESLQAIKDLKAAVAAAAGDPVALAKLAADIKTEVDAMAAADAGLDAELNPPPPAVP